MRRPPLPGTAPDHFVIAIERAVEKYDVGAGEALRHRRRDGRRAWDVGQPRAGRGNLGADIGGGFSRGLGIVALEVERQLAGHGEQLCLQSAGELERRAWNHCPSRHHSGCQHTPNTALSASIASVPAVAQIVNGSRSRRLSSPAIWSTSPPVRTTALIGLPRVPVRGCSWMVRRSW